MPANIGIYSKLVGGEHAGIFQSVLQISMAVRLRPPKIPYKHQPLTRLSCCSPSLLIHQLKGKGSAAE